MNKRIRDCVAFFCAVGLLVLLTMFMMHIRPIEVDLPQISMQDITAHQEKEQKKAQESAARAKIRKIYACETDEDCIIVDKDPCGCAAGPSGVTAINALYTLEFNSLNLKRSIAKTCAEIPSTEKECSPNAQAVCRSKTCTITY